MTDLFGGRFTLKPSEFQGYFVVEDDREASPAARPDDPEHTPFAPERGRVTEDAT